MNNSTLSIYLHRHENILENIIQDSVIPAPRIREAMHYSLFPGGKRIRPLLVYLCGELLEVNIKALDVIAAAVEITHCYSLIHDDLPAMDDDNMRRGKPSCHRAFDEATAILVGDGMQALAVEMLLKKLLLHLPVSSVLAVSYELVKASGVSGKVSGQSLDLLELSKPDIEEAQLRQIHDLKTGCLIKATVKMVLAAAANTSSEKTVALERFAHLLGLVFQMQDDYLDQYGPMERSGKDRSSDLANQKTTFATLYNPSDLLDLINGYYKQIYQILDIFGDKAKPLYALINSLEQRNHF